MLVFVEVQWVIFQAVQFLDEPLESAFQRGHVQHVPDRPTSRGSGRRSNGSGFTSRASCRCATTPTIRRSYKITQWPEWFRTRKLFGGTIPWIGIHMVDLMRWIGGREFVEAASFQARLGFPALGEMDYCRPPAAPTHGDDRLRLAGTAGVIEYRTDSGVVLMSGREKTAVLDPVSPARGLFAAFLEAVYAGKANDFGSEEVLRLTEIVLRAREAAEAHRLVRL